MTQPLAPLLLVLAVVYVPPAMVLARTDLREHRLPNAWVGGMSLAVLAALGLLALLEPALRAPLRTAVVLAVVVGVLGIAVALLAPPVLGMGDAKTLPVVVLMAGVLGGEVLIGALLGMAVLGGLVGLVVLVLTRRRGVAVPVGPVLLAGPLLGLAARPLVAAALGTA